MKIIFLLFTLLLSVTYSVIGSEGERESKKINADRFDIKLKNVSLKTIEKKIRANQDECLRVEKEIKEEEVKLSELLKLNKTTITPQVHTSKKEVSKTLSLLQLSIIDSESLEGIAEESMIMKKYQKIIDEKKGQNQRMNKMTQKEIRIGRIRHLNPLSPKHKKALIPSFIKENYVKIKFY
jgi:hypothetical protein